MNRFRIRLAAVLASLITSCALMAQTATTGAMLGTISDPSGAVVPKAEIQLVNVDTNAADKVTTNEAGQFMFASLTPAHYKITVRVPGFRTASVANLVVEVNKSLSVPVALEVGADTQVVEVTANAGAQLQTV